MLNGFSAVVLRPKLSCALYRIKAVIEPRPYIRQVLCIDKHRLSLTEEMPVKFRTGRFKASVFSERWSVGRYLASRVSKFDSIAVAVADQLGHGINVNLKAHNIGSGTATESIESARTKLGVDGC
jgi:hypothetical protein